MSYEIIGLGNALLDFQLEVPESTLKELQIKKGSMNLVEAPYQLKVLAELDQKLGKDKLQVSSGGSLANSLAGFANLGGRAALIAKVGDDENGKTYASDMAQAGVDFFSKPEGKNATGTCLALITPDAERTMLTSLGISVEIEESDIQPEKIGSSKILFVEGYMWDSPSGKTATLQAVELAKEKGVKIAITLSDSFCVQRHKEAFVDFVKNSADIVFANEAEAIEITSTKTEDEAFAELKTWAEKVFVSIGPKGALGSEDFGKNTTKAPTWNVQVKDLIGAGDLFAAGVLFGLTRQKNLQESCFIGCYAASKVIQQMSTRLSIDLSKEVDTARKGPGEQAVA